MNRNRRFPILILQIVLSTALFCQDHKQEALKQFQNENYQEAIKNIRLAIQKSPTDAELYFYLAQSYHYLAYDSVPLDQNPESVSDTVLANLRTTSQLDPTLREAYYFLASEYGAKAIRRLRAGDIRGFQQNLQKAQKEGGYPDWLVEYARNILKSCNIDALLITGGDAEVFPLWYCQFVENFRKDVTILPYGLLDRPWFIDLVRSGTGGFCQPVPSSWSRDQILDAHPYKWAEQKIDLSPPNGSSAKVVLSITPDLSSQSRGFLSSGKALLIDILKANSWKRPIHFSLGSPQSATSDFNSHLQIRGITRQLAPFSIKETDSLVNLEPTQTLLKTESNFKDLPTLSHSNIPRVSNVLQNYRIAFLLTAQSFLKLNLSKQAVGLLATMDKVFPSDLLPIPQSFQDEFDKIKKMHQDN